MNKTSLLRSIDSLVGIIHSLSIKNREKKIGRVRKILFIRAWALGATILTIPTLKELRKRYPKADIEVLTINTGEVFRRSCKNIHVSKLNISWVLRKLFKPKSYDLVIDTEDFSNISALIARYLGRISIGFGYLSRGKAYNYSIKFNDKQHYVYVFMELLKPLGVKSKPKRLISFKYTKREKEKVDKLLVKGKKIIGIHAGGGSTAQQRLWPRERFVELIKKILKNKKVIVYLTGTQSEKEINEYIEKRINSDRLINLTNKLNLGELAYLMKRTDLFISNDTGPMHLAAAMSKKVIGLFGPNLPERFAPFPMDKHIAIYKARSLKCSPCINVHLKQLGNKKCKGKCMKLIEVEDVWKEVRKVIK